LSKTPEILRTNSRPPSSLPPLLPLSVGAMVPAPRRPPRRRAPMPKVIILAAALAVLALPPVMALQADWGAPAAPIAAATPIDPLELMQQAVDLVVQEIVDFTTVGDHSAGQ